MLPLAEQFLTSIKARLDPSSSSISKYITEKTYLNGRKFSYKRHEFQEFIANLIDKNPGHTFKIKKCSQIGLSELFNRIVLAKMAVRPGEGALVSFPSKTFAQEVIKTRISDVISESPELRALQDRNVDSASVKKFHNNSILYGLGGNKSSNSSLLNRPISLVLVDELDRQNPDIYTGYHSRMTHTAEIQRLILYLSTPTAPGVGIDQEFNTCRIQHFAELICNSCDHQFEPDYYEHVVLPSFDEPLQMLTKARAARLDVDSAFLECPGCGASLNYDTSTPAYREHINLDGTDKHIGVALSPFIAMGFISIPQLVRSSYTYTSKIEFLNQGLGQTASLKDTSITPDNLTFIAAGPQPGVRIFGLDMGKLCAFVSGVLRADTTVHVDTIEYIKLSELEDFWNKQPLFIAGVMDSMPYSDLVYNFVRKYPRLFSAIYLDPVPAPPELYKLRMHDKHGELVRQINITKNKAMDLLASSLKDFYTFQSGKYDALLTDHITSMRRIRDYRYYDAEVYRWVKPKDGEDHFFHAMNYLYMASKLALSDLAFTHVTPPDNIHSCKSP